MFKYLWMVSQDLFLCVTLTTLMNVILSRLYGRKGSRLHGIALCVGVLASVALAAVKYNTNLIISSHWNHYIYAVVLVLTAIVGRKENQKLNAGGILLCVSGSLLSATFIFYALSRRAAVSVQLQHDGSGLFVFLLSGAHGRVAGRAAASVRVFAPAFPLRAVYDSFLS